MVADVVGQKACLPTGALGLLDTRIAARQRLQDAVTACCLPTHAGVAILAAAESYGKALYVEAMKLERQLKLAPSVSMESLRVA